ncbi:unnamed protein product [Pleuronectes platessa]|uniref:Uncharacterized protein n=1 Tax=Pleuronectes platessa TaxID=8262 RepID=A0A9N7YLR0_PLEPL|nr:unnamed protein product [Pleuronectes platessa]
MLKPPENSHQRVVPSPARSGVNDVVTFAGPEGVTQRASGHGCEAAVSQLEPSVSHHMIGALVMAIMTAVAAVAGLLRGYDQLRKCHSLLPLTGRGGGTN